jgi:hypothetical protein
MSFRIYSILLVTLIFFSCGKEREAPFLKSADTLFQFLDSAKTGITFSNDLKENRSMNYLFYQSIYNGAGVGIADLDNDGLEDIFFAGNQVTDRLYRNEGEMHFSDISTKAGIIQDDGWSTGVTIVDLDGNGYKDIYVCRFLVEDPSKRKNLLYMNQGGMKFLEQASRYGLDDQGYSIQAAFLDYDQDGDLDMFLANQPPNHSSRRMALKDSLDYRFSNRLFNNDGLSFTEVTKSAGLLDMAYSFSAICSDINQDGWPDIYVTNDFDEPDALYINQQDGTFKDASHEQLRHMSNFSMGADIADMNNDGLFDIFTADMVAEDNKRLKTNMSGMNPKKFKQLVADGKHHQYMFNALQLNRGEDRFSEIGQMAGVYATDWSWTALFSDFDLDGNKDLLVTNGLKRDVRDNDFNIARRKRVKELEEEAKREGRSGISVNPIELLSMSPSTGIPNYLFQNKGDLSFENVAASWGLERALISQGTALSDLDNDGDMDLVMNNMDQLASIVENKREAYVDHHWLQVALERDIVEGSVVKITSASGIQVQEYLTVRGFMSSSASVLQFGLGKDSYIEEIAITWPDGKRQFHKDVDVDQRLTLSPKASDNKTFPEEKAMSRFAEIPFDYIHTENEYNDFETEILLPHRMSTLGPCQCAGDMNADGNEDLYIGGARGQEGKVFFTSEKGVQSAMSIAGSALYEDTGCALFDSDGDGDLDLYVVSGGNEERDDLRSYQDRLYLNDGDGNFQESATLLPKTTVSGKSVRAIDFDSDGDLDLFVGGRQVPGKYPYPADSKLLINEGGRFIDLTESLAPELFSLGMVTDALWHDRDGDGDPDLTLVGEWMPITFFENDNGQLRKSGIIENSVGWWNCIASIDADKDGDEDLIVGNLGLNIKYKASPSEPFEIYSDDFDNNGSNDIYMAYYQDGKCFPVRGRQCSSQQMPFIKEKFPSYELFSEATVLDVLGEEANEAIHYAATEFASIVLRNDEGTYVKQSLPALAQVSVVNSVLAYDLDGDGADEVLLAGNLYDREVETTRSDASYGLVLRWDDEYGAYSVWDVGLDFGGDVRGMHKIALNQKNLIVITRNNDQASVFAEIQVNE